MPKLNKKTGQKSWTDNAQDDIKMATGHLKRSSNLLRTREIQNKITLRYHFSFYQIGENLHI